MDSKQEYEIARRCRAGNPNPWRAAAICAAHLGCSHTRALELVSDAVPNPGDEPIRGTPAAYEVARTIRAGKSVMLHAGNIAAETRTPANEVREIARSMTEERVTQLLGAVHAQSGAPPAVQERGPELTHERWQAIKERSERRRIERRLRDANLHFGNIVSLKDSV